MTDKLENEDIYNELHRLFDLTTKFQRDSIGLVLQRLDAIEQQLIRLNSEVEGNEQ